MPTKKNTTNNLNDQENTNPSEILEDLMEPAKKFKSDFDKENQQITKKDTDELIDAVAEYYAVPRHVALVGIFATLQRGGTSRNKKSNVRVRNTGTTYESKVINSYITKINKNITPRQFARYFANEIFEIARAHNIDGNCYVYISRYLPDLLTENRDERYWASDFQVENTLCPENIRRALNIRYNEKFRGGTRKNPS